MNYEILKEQYKDNKECLKIVNNYIEINNYNNRINEKIFGFLNKCSDLEEHSNHNYELQKTLELNKIYFQGYILESQICKSLKENNTNYSIQQLKQYIVENANNLGDEYSAYYEAIELYEMADEIEELIDEKIELEMTTIYGITDIIKDIENISKNDYENLYLTIKFNIENNYLNKNIIDSNIYELCISMLNDIFNYFISGYPEIGNFR